MSKHSVQLILGIFLNILRVDQEYSSCIVYIFLMKVRILEGIRWLCHWK